MAYIDPIQADIDRLAKSREKARQQKAQAEHEALWQRRERWDREREKAWQKADIYQPMLDNGEKALHKADKETEERIAYLREQGRKRERARQLKIDPF